MKNFLGLLLLVRPNQACTNIIKENKENKRRIDELEKLYYGSLPTNNETELDKQRQQNKWDIKQIKLEAEKDKLKDKINELEEEVIKSQEFIEEREEKFLNKEMEFLR